MNLECWDNDPDNRPTINQVVEILLKISPQLLDTQEINNSNNSKFSSSLLLQNVDFGKMVPMATNKQTIDKNISFGKDLSIVINEIVTFINEINDDVSSKHIFDYFNSNNISSQEVYDWLLNNQNDSDSTFLLGLFNFFRD